MNACGIIGLGRMGAAAAAHLIAKGQRVVVSDLAQEQVEALAAKGATPAASVANLVRLLPQPRVVWLMLPAGEAVESVCFAANGLLDCLAVGDIVIDGGNSFYRDAVRRAARFAEKNVSYLDCGSSGGLEGARSGLCLMLGGDRSAFLESEWLFKALSSPAGDYAYIGPSGSGHFVKMVHNAIEYGMLQAIGEGFELLEAGPYDVEMAQLAALWNKGSVIRSWLMELLHDALVKDSGLAQIGDVVGGGSTGSWAIEEAWRSGVPFATIAASYAARLQTRQSEAFSGKVVAALRNEFGGHPVVPAKK